jgi:hypothetical protein
MRIARNNITFEEKYFHPSIIQWRYGRCYDFFFVDPQEKVPRVPKEVQIDQSRA